MFVSGLQNYNTKVGAVQTDVYFDDVTMRYTPTNIIQHNEYYPYGLQASTSWTRDNTTGNNFLANGGTEINTTTGWYDLLRNYDPTIGRFMQVDPLATDYASFSSYHYSFNNPVMYNDPSGAGPGDGPMGPAGYYDSNDRWNWNPSITDPGPSDGAMARANSDYALADRIADDVWRGRQGTAINRSQYADVLYAANAGTLGIGSKNGKAGYWSIVSYTDDSSDSKFWEYGTKLSATVVGPHFTPFDSDNRSGQPQYNVPVWGESKYGGDALNDGRYIDAAAWTCLAFADMCSLGTLSEYVLPAKIVARTSTSLWPAASGGRTVINGIEYTNHALERMQPVGTIMKGTEMFSRGVPPSVIENAIQYGTVTPGKTAAEVVRTFENVRVITNPIGDRVITVINKAH